MSATLRNTLGDAAEAVLPTSARTYPFYVNLLGPTLASAGYVDISSLRERGNIAFNLPYGLSFTYLRDVKTGSRGESGGNILGGVSPVIDVLEPLDEVTQDFGIRWNYSYKKMGNAYASFNRNLYNDRVNELVIDNPFRATDATYNSTTASGGPAQVRFSTPPDNEASRFAFGGQLKLARQTRIGADLSFQNMTQDAAFLPFTIITVIFTPSGVPATSLSGTVLAPNGTLPLYGVPCTLRTPTRDHSPRVRCATSAAIRPARPSRWRPATRPATSRSPMCRRAPTSRW